MSERPTPETDACPHCGSEPYNIDDRDFWMCGTIRYEEKCVVRTDLCSEREARKAAESKFAEAREQNAKLLSIAERAIDDLRWFYEGKADGIILELDQLKKETK